MSTLEPEEPNADASAAPLPTDPLPLAVAHGRFVCDCLCCFCVVQLFSASAADTARVKAARLRPVLQAPLSVVRSASVL